MIRQKCYIIWSNFGRLKIWMRANESSIFIFKQKQSLTSVSWPKWWRWAIPVRDNPSLMKRTEFLGIWAQLCPWIPHSNRETWVVLYLFTHLKYITLKMSILNIFTEMNTTFNNTFTQLSQSSETEIYFYV